MYLADILAELKQQGFKVTPRRKAIIQTLEEFGRPITAKEIHARVKQFYPDTSLDTIYRNLNLMANLGVINQINLRGKENSRFEIGQHHHHLICLSCGKSQCLDQCPIDIHSILSQSSSDFFAVSHAFEIYGYCSKCRNQS